MSSHAFRSENRTPDGWRRLRHQGHLYEAPVERRGHRQVTLLHQAVHVPDCPKCHAG